MEMAIDLPLCLQLTPPAADCMAPGVFGGLQLQAGSDEFGPVKALPFPWLRCLVQG